MSNNLKIYPADILKMINAELKVVEEKLAELKVKRLRLLLERELYI